MNGHFHLPKKSLSQQLASLVRHSQKSQKWQEKILKYAAHYLSSTQNSALKSSVWRRLDMAQSITICPCWSSYKISLILDINVADLREKLIYSEYSWLSTKTELQTSAIWAREPLPVPRMLSGTKLTFTNLLLFSSATLTSLQPTPSLSLMFFLVFTEWSDSGYLNHLHPINYLLCKRIHTFSWTEGIQHGRRYSQCSHISHIPPLLFLLFHKSMLPSSVYHTHPTVLCAVFWSLWNSAAAKHHKNLSNCEPKLSCNDKSPH